MISCKGFDIQVQKIRLLLRSKGLGSVRVGTVDDLQGQEERIIFISTVLSRPETLPASTGGADLHLGFWKNPRRFNVAVTRAKALLVVLGHPLVLLEASCSLLCSQSALPPLQPSGVYVQVKTRQVMGAIFAGSMLARIAAALRCARCIQRGRRACSCSTHPLRPSALSAF